MSPSKSLFEELKATTADERTFGYYGNTVTYNNQGRERVNIAAQISLFYMIVDTVYVQLNNSYILRGEAVT